jgi:transketolase
MKDAYQQDELLALRKKAYELRLRVIEMIYEGRSGHPGGSLSAAEIITALYWKVLHINPNNPKWEDRDRFVLSKGHASPIVYAALAERGFFDIKELKTLRGLGSILQGYPDCKKTPGLDATTGSLGQGLSIGVGMALGAKQSFKKYNTYVLLSDGEMQEGMTWEAAMAASHYKLDNLTAIIDRNNLQVDGHIEEVMNIEPLDEKWRAFGWQCLIVDGHDMESVLTALELRKSIHKKPLAIICKTTKGKGVSYMEDVMEWHATLVTKELYETAAKELIETIEKEFGTP